VASPAAVAPVTPSVSASSPSATPSAVATASTPSPRATNAPALRIGSVSNFRDVAGAGLPLGDGGTMATGVVYRSAKLSTLSAADRRRLAKAGLSLVIDLRTTAVVRNAPDPSIAGARYELVNIYGTPRSPRLASRTPAAAKAYMRSLNVGFVADAGQRSRIADALRLIARADGPVVIHCTEGKDRTGWVSAVLQLAAGADRDTVMEEYLRSNTYRADEIDSAVRSARRAGGTQEALTTQALLTVDASYLAAGLDELDRRYGDIDSYLSDGLGLSKATIAALRARLAG